MLNDPDSGNSRRSLRSNIQTLSVAVNTTAFDDLLETIIRDQALTVGRPIRLVSSLDPAKLRFENVRSMVFDLDKAPDVDLEQAFSAATEKSVSPINFVVR